ncbi:unnamed protein product, partial [Sphacelaria rigidula]
PSHLSQNSFICGQANIVQQRSSAKQQQLRRTRTALLSIPTTNSSIIVNMAQRSTSVTMSAWVQAAICASGFFLARPPQQVDGHAFMMAPVSRTFFYTTVFQKAGFAEMEHCPHCMQSKGPAA